MRSVRHALIIVLASFCGVAVAQPTTAPATQPITLAPGKVDRLTAPRGAASAPRPDPAFLERKVEQCRMIDGEVWIRNFSKGPELGIVGGGQASGTISSFGLQSLQSGPKSPINEKPNFVRLRDGKFSVDYPGAPKPGEVKLADGYIVRTQGAVVIYRTKAGEYWAVVGLSIDQMELWEKATSQYQGARFNATFAGQRGPDRAVRVGGTSREIPSLVVDPKEGDKLTAGQLGEYLAANGLTRWPAAVLEEKKGPPPGKAEASKDKPRAGFLDRSASKGEGYREWGLSWSLIPTAK